MTAGKQRNIKSGLQYDRLFPKANVNDHTVLREAGVSDTVAFIPKVVAKTLDHTKGIAGVLKGRSDYESCRNIWEFVYGHIAYRKDKEGYEQIRSPARSWHDRRAGVDCDCYTTFISSILSNLGISHKLRITKYSKDYFQHIYPIAQVGGKPVILDCVTDKFDYEVPYSEKKDYAMDLQYLDGLGNIGYNDNYLLNGSDEMAELGRLFKKRNKALHPKKKHKGLNLKRLNLKRLNLKKVLNVVNKFNPATIALRNGVLASMKINVGNVAGRLRWSYITADQARAKRMDMGRWQQLVKTREKLERIFFGAGGKPANLKKAILHGKGNKDNGVHGVEGFGAISYGIHYNHPEHPLNRISKHTPLRQLLGDDMFFSENSLSTLGELGEPVSMSMIAAASGVIAAIAANLKKIGDIFGGKGEGAKDFDTDTNKEAEKEIATDDKGTSDSSGGGSSSSGDSDERSDYGSGSGDSSSKNRSTRNGQSSYSSGESDGGEGSSDGGGGSVSRNIQSSGGGSASSGGSGESGGGENGSSGGEEEGGTNGGGTSKAMVKAGAPTGADNSDDADPKPGFWDQNKKWIVPVGIGVAGVGILAIAAQAMKHTPPVPSRPMNGTPAKRPRKKATGKKVKLVSKRLV